MVKINAVIALLAIVALAGFTAVMVLSFRDQPASSPPVAAAGGTIRNFSVSGPPKPVPAASFRTAGDATTDLGQFRGKVLLVNLWASWCIPCRVEMPALDKLAADLDGPDFQVLAVAEHDGRDKAEAFLNEVGAHHIVLGVDDSMKSAYAWGAEGLPATLLIDREGREVGRVIGPADWNAPEVRAVIRDLIDKKAG
jgi:thiol-disulfide isomerase/thioredoxin